MLAGVDVPSIYQTPLELALLIKHIKNEQIKDLKFNLMLAAQTFDRTDDATVQDMNKLVQRYNSAIGVGKNKKENVDFMDKSMELMKKLVGTSLDVNVDKNAGEELKNKEFTLSAGN